MTERTAPQGTPDGRPVLLPVLERGAQITGPERDRIGVDIARAVWGGESCSSVARRMNRSKQWVTDMVAQHDPSALPVNLRGDHRPVMVRLIAKEYRAGASVHALTLRWRLVRPTVIRLLAEAAIDARTRIPRPSREWRLANLPPEVLPTDLDAAPTDEEWVYICAYLTGRREARAAIRSLVDETGLSYSTVYRRLTALRVQPDQTQPHT